MSSAAETSAPAISPSSPTRVAGESAFSVGCKLDLVELAEAMPSMVNRAFAGSGAAKDFDRLVAAIFVNLLDTPDIADDAVTEDLGAQIFSHRAIIARPPALASKRLRKVRGWRGKFASTTQ
jgi:hypothetical protein